MELNSTAYEVKKDKLVYDAKHPLDAANVPVKVASDVSGTIRRGQVLDCADGEYSVHKAGGKAGAIVAETESYAADDTEIIVSVYVSGTFRTSEVIADSELTEADIAELRSKGIFLK